MFKSTFIDNMNSEMVKKAVRGGGPAAMLPMQASPPFNMLPGPIASRMDIPVGYNANLQNTSSVPSHIQTFTPALTNLI
jgi:hypothetical protein